MICSIVEFTCFSKNVPFAIPVRKTTPAMDTLQVSDDGSSTPTIRSRSSTIEGIATFHIAAHKCKKSTESYVSSALHW